MWLVDSVQMKGRCAEVKLWDDDQWSGDASETADADRQYPLYWSKRDLPDDLEDDVGAIKVQTMPRSTEEPIPPALSSHCKLTFYGKKNYLGEKAVYETYNAYGEFIQIGSWRQFGSFMAEGFCNKVVLYYNPRDGGTCDSSSAKNKPFQSQTGLSNPDTFGVSDLTHHGFSYGGYKDALCKILLFAKPPLSHHDYLFCPHRIERKVDFTKGLVSWDNKRVSPNTFFCQKPFFQEGKTSCSEGTCYHRTHEVSGSVREGKVVFLEQPTGALRMNEMCTHDKQCGTGKCIEKEERVYSTVGTETSWRLEKRKRCKSEFVAPLVAGQLDCAECAKPCPKGTSQVVLEEIFIGSHKDTKKGNFAARSTKSVNVCHATVDTLRCPTDVSHMNWIAKPVFRGSYTRDKLKFKITVSDGKVSAKRTDNEGGGLDRGWSLDLKFNCMRCITESNGPIRTTLRHGDVVIRTTDPKPFVEGFSRWKAHVINSQYHYWDGDYCLKHVFPTTKSKNCIGTSSSKKVCETDVFTNAGQGYGLVLAKCLPLDNKDSVNQMLRFDPRSGNIIILDNNQIEPMCITALPRDHSGLFWPTDQTWVNNGYSWKWIEGTYVSVETCLPTDIPTTAFGYEVKETTDKIKKVTKTRGVSREGQMWEMVPKHDNKNVINIRHKRTGMCLGHFTEASGYNDGPTYYAGDYPNTLKPTKQVDHEMWMGLQNCKFGEDKVYWFADAGDSLINKLDIGKINAEVSMSEKYEKILMPSDSLGTKDALGNRLWTVATYKKFDGSNSSPRQATLTAKDVAFTFSPGDNVHEKSQGCTVGTVINCTNLSCQVKGLKAATYTSAELSPAEADWPKGDAQKKLMKKVEEEQKQDEK